MGLGQLAERAVGEGDHRGLAVVVAVDHRVEAQRARARTSASRHEAASACGRRRRRPCSRPISAASSAPTPAAAASRDEQRASSGVRRAAPGRATGPRRPASRGAGGARRRPAASVRTSSRPTSRMRSRWGRTVLGCSPSASATSAVASGRATAPARGRWRTGCCRRAPSGRRAGSSVTHSGDYTAIPVKSDAMPPAAPAPPHSARPIEVIFGLLRGRDRPRAGRQHRRARAWSGRDRRAASGGDGGALVTIAVKLTIGGCPLRAQIKNDVETRIAHASRASARCASTGAR